MNGFNRFVLIVNIKTGFDQLLLFLNIHQAMCFKVDTNLVSTDYFGSPLHFKVRFLYWVENNCALSLKVG